MLVILLFCLSQISPSFSMPVFFWNKLSPVSVTPGSVQRKGHKAMVTRKNCLFGLVTLTFLLASVAVTFPVLSDRVKWNYWEAVTIQDELPLRDPYFLG